MFERFTDPDGCSVAKVPGEGSVYRDFLASYQRHLSWETKKEEPIQPHELDAAAKKTGISYVEWP